MLTNFQSNGFEIIEKFLSSDQLINLKNDLKSVSLNELKGGIRNAEKKFLSIKSLVSSEQLLAKAQNYLLNSPKLVRVILFDKSPANNWLVPWHQDRTVAVSGKFESKEWGPWSIKDETLHVQPPLEVLNQMVAFRIHIDDATRENGCLKIIPKSHLLGLLSPSEIQTYTEKEACIECEAKEGSVLIMRPHLLHSSGKANGSKHLRVIHIEYSSFQLPDGIDWV